MYRRRAPNLSRGLKEGFLKEVTPKQRPERPVRVGERRFWAVAEAQAKKGLWARNALGPQATAQGWRESLRWSG